MVKKKDNNLRETEKQGERWMTEDVKVHTGLPPKVEGQLRCFCKVAINQVIWIGASPPSTMVQIKWWGEDGEGVFFRPHDVKKGTKTTSTQTTARYPVRSGPKQFAAYLNDMANLNLEVFTMVAGKSQLALAGTARISQICLLSNNRPINGFFPILDSLGKKIGELQVSIMLEPLMASFDGTTSVPTTDINTDVQKSQDSALPVACMPQPHGQLPEKPREDPCISPASHTGETRSKPGVDMHHNFGDHGHMRGSPVAITTNGTVISMSNLQGNGLPLRATKPSASDFLQRSMPEQIEDGGDLLSMLLDRGNNLRQAMVVSSLSRSQEEDDSKSSLPAQHKFLVPHTSVRGVSAVVTPGAVPATAFNSHLVKAAHSPVDMLLGSPVGKNDWQVLQLINGLSPEASICSEAMDTVSEPGDPLHDNALLHELFYKHAASDSSELIVEEDVKLNKSHSSGSLHDPGNMRPPSRSSSVSSLIGVMPEPAVGSDFGKGKRRTKSVEDSFQHSKKSRSLLHSKHEIQSETRPMEGERSSSRSRSQSRSRSRSRSRSHSSSRCGSHSGTRKASKRKTKAPAGKKKDRVDVLSDSDIPSTPRSETSRVSFDPVLSDAEETEQDPRFQSKSGVDGLSIERLTLLGRVHMARVSVHSLHLDSLDLGDSGPSKVSHRVPKRSGRPPRPVKNKKPCIYLVEYQFPVVAISRDKFSPNTMATEVMRVASKTENNGVITFGHRSVFPLLFDGAALEKWWKSALIFRVFSREKGQQSPCLVGSCGLPLKAILKSDDLRFTPQLEVREAARNSTSSISLRPSSRTRSLGTLKVSVELASDHKDFPTALAQTKVAELNSTCKIIPIAPPSLPPPAGQQQSSSSVPSASVMENQAFLSGNKTVGTQPVRISGVPTAEPEDCRKPVPSGVVDHSIRPQISSQPEQPFLDQQVLTLHLLLLVTQGYSIAQQGTHPATKNPFPLQQHLASENVASAGITSRNTYIVCRMFWCNDTVRSAVCWGTVNPCYDFCQIAPVLVTPSILDRMRDNYMILEVWDKKASQDNDKLIGITKLSLHQFFMSFREKKIANTLLRSQYPVIAIDNCMAVVDPFSGLQFGQLSILLAMGSLEQVNNLRRMKLEGSLTGERMQRPQTVLERQDFSEVSGRVNASEATSVEHIFEVTVEGVRGFCLLESMIWGEADCFVQYCFPKQTDPRLLRQNHVLAMPTMQFVCTPTTLCVPDLSFDHVTRHKFVLPLGVPLQRELLTACADRAGGRLQFEVWCRFYHPNIRDQLMARAMLPLAKVCAMVTMQKHGQSAVQSFSLPLTLVSSKPQDEDALAKVKDMGLVDITVRYKTQIVDDKSQLHLMRDSSHVCISIDVIRATGLRAAAEAAARLDPRLQYPAEVGVNAYVRVRLSFNEKDERTTSTVARTFSPNFSHHVEFPVPLVFSAHDDDAASLAHALESGQVELEVWHKVPGLPPSETELDHTGDTADKQVTPDVLLGICTVPIAPLLTRHTGITGWFAVNRPCYGPAFNLNEAASPSQSDLAGTHMVGGLEMSVHFAHASDRQLVIEAALSRGWSPRDFGDEQDWWLNEGTENPQQYQLVISIDRVSVPASCVALPGQSTPDANAQCYFRYRAYDKAPVVSKMSYLKEDGQKLWAEFQHKHVVTLKRSAQLQWYLREELVQVQVWVTNRCKDKVQRPYQKDKLIGTAYVDLSCLCDTYSYRHYYQISKLLALFKPGVDSLENAAIKLDITAKLCRDGRLSDGDMMGDTVVSEELSDGSSEDSNHQHKATNKSPSKSPGSKMAEDPVDTGPVFTVYLNVERALHLPTVHQTTRSEEVAPTTYVSFPQAGKSTPTYTDIVANSVNPVWDYEAEVPLSTELLTEDSKNLVLKVWHKPDGARQQPDKSCDRVLGFVSVDLSPLRSGLRRISGWYNVVDFNGLNRGQIKVSIIPVSLHSAATNTSADGDPLLSMLSHRGGSVYSPPAPQFPVECHQPQPISATSHLASLPAFSAAVSAHHLQDRHSPVSFPPSQDVSKSVLFASLRQQLKDLDTITNRLRQRLICEESDVDANQPSSARSADVLTGTQSGLSTIHTNSSFLGTHEENSRLHSRSAIHDENSQLHSHSGTREMVSGLSQPINITAEDVFNSAGDSGAFSGDNTARTLDALDSQRSQKQVVFSVTGDRSVVAGLDLQNSFPESNRMELSVPKSHETAVSAEATVSSAHASMSCSPQEFARSSQTSQGFMPGADSASASAQGQESRLAFLQEKKTAQNLSDIRMTKGRGDEEAEVQINRDGMESESEDDDLFGSYHQYRAMLDREEDQQEEGNVSLFSDRDFETITPRRINDVSSMLQDFAHSNRVGHMTLPSARPFSVFGNEVAAGFSRTFPNLPGQENMPTGNNNDGVNKNNQKLVRGLPDGLHEPDDNLFTDQHSFVDSWLAESSVHDTDLTHHDKEQSSGRKQISAKHSTLTHKNSAGNETTAQASREKLMESEANVTQNGKAELSDESHNTAYFEDSLASSLEDSDHVQRGVADINSNALNSYVTPDRELRMARGAHLLSNVDLDSVSSGCLQQTDSSGRKHSHTSSVSSNCFHFHKSTPEEEEEELRKGQELGEEDAAHMPLSSRSLKASDLFPSSHESRAVYSGHCESSDDDFTHHPHAPGGRRTEIKNGSIAASSDPPATEDSGLGSGVKSSQDERDNASIPDAAFSHATSHKARPSSGFFLSVEELHASLQALQLATSAATATTAKPLIKASQSVASNELEDATQKPLVTSGVGISSIRPVRGQQLPTAEEVKRIAKIFSTKIS